MKVLLDTNILLQAISHKNRLRPIWTAFLNEKYDLIVSNSILLEYEEKIAEKTSQQVAINVVSLISEAVNTILVTVYYQWNIITSDPDDNKFCDTAVAGNADYIVTNDSHFNEAKKINFPIVNILSASYFINIIQAMK
jgi:putative PIN family toxin of toxin-antitoxin system